MAHQHCSSHSRSEDSLPTDNASLRSRFGREGFCCLQIYDRVNIWSIKASSSWAAWKLIIDFFLYCKIWHTKFYECVDNPPNFIITDMTPSKATKEKWMCGKILPALKHDHDEAFSWVPQWTRIIACRRLVNRKKSVLANFCSNSVWVRK